MWEVNKTEILFYSHQFVNDHSLYKVYKRNLYRRLLCPRHVLSFISLWRCEVCGERYMWSVSRTICFITFVSRSDLFSTSRLVTLDRIVSILTFFWLVNLSYGRFCSLNDLLYYVNFMVLEILYELQIIHTFKNWTYFNVGILPLSSLDKIQLEFN